MEFTLGEVIIILFALILIVYYIFSIRYQQNNCDTNDTNDIKKDYNNDENENENDIKIDNENENEDIEDMSGGLSNNIKILQIKPEEQNYNLFKEIIELNSNKSKFRNSDIDLWIPFFALNISLSPNEIEKAKELNDSHLIFSQLIYPKIVSMSTDLIEKLTQLKLIIVKNNKLENNQLQNNKLRQTESILKSIDIYITFLKQYGIYYIHYKYNNISGETITELQQKDSNVNQINNLILSLISTKK